MNLAIPCDHKEIVARIDLVFQSLPGSIGKKKCSNAFFGSTCQEYADDIHQLTAACFEARGTSPAFKSCSKWIVNYDHIYHVSIVETSLLNTI